MCPFKTPLLPFLLAILHLTMRAWWHHCTSQDFLRSSGWFLLSQTRTVIISAVIRSRAVTVSTVMALLFSLQLKVEEHPSMTGVQSNYMLETCVGETILNPWFKKKKKIHWHKGAEKPVVGKRGHTTATFVTFLHVKFSHHNFKWNYIEKLKVMWNYESKKQHFLKVTWKRLRPKISIQPFKFQMFWKEIKENVLLV